MRPWYRSWVGSVTDAKFDEVALIAGVTSDRAFRVWHYLLEDCSKLEQRGAFEITARRIGASLRAPIAEIEAVFAAFAEIGMITGAPGVVVNWNKRQFDSDAPGSSTARVQRYRAVKQAAGGEPTLPFGADPAGVGTDPPINETPCNGDPSLQRPDVTLSESDPDPDPESSSSVIPFPRATTDDDEILIGKIGKALGPKCELRVVRGGLPVVRGWIAEGCDLELDVLPELADIGRKLRKPLQTLAASPWIGAQVFARRDGRLAAQKARGGRPPAPAKVFVEVDTPEWARRVAAGHKSGLRATHTVDGRRVEGWYFPADSPPTPDLAKAASAP